MTCGKPHAEYVEGMCFATQLGRGQGDAALRCRNPKCNLPLKKDGTCPRGCRQDDAPADPSETVMAKAQALGDATGRGEWAAARSLLEQLWEAESLQSLSTEQLEQVLGIMSRAGGMIPRFSAGEYQQGLQRVAEMKEQGDLDQAERAAFALWGEVADWSPRDKVELMRLYTAICAEQRAAHHGEPDRAAWDILLCSKQLGVTRPWADLADPEGMKVVAECYQTLAEALAQDGDAAGAKSARQEEATINKELERLQSLGMVTPSPPAEDVLPVAAGAAAVEGVNHQLATPAGFSLDGLLGGCSPRQVVHTDARTGEQMVEAEGVSGVGVLYQEDGEGGTILSLLPTRAEGFPETFRQAALETVRTWLRAMSLDAAELPPEPTEAVPAGARVTVEFLNRLLQPDKWEGLADIPAPFGHHPWLVRGAKYDVVVRDLLQGDYEVLTFLPHDDDTNAQQFRTGVTRLSKRLLRLRRSAE